MKLRAARSASVSSKVQLGRGLEIMYYDNRQNGCPSRLVWTCQYCRILGLSQDKVDPPPTAGTWN
jgi:hypothetical protein